MNRWKMKIEKTGYSFEGNSRGERGEKSERYRRLGVDGGHEQRAIALLIDRLNRFKQIKSLESFSIIPICNKDAM